MPKIIQGVSEKIITSAVKLFEKHGYEGVEMKLIAKEAGMAVGTLYNYYPNKKELYTSILEKSWQDAFEQLRCICALEIEKEYKIRKFVTKLYEEAERRKGLGMEMNLSASKELAKDKKIIDNNMEALATLQELFLGIIGDTPKMNKDDIRMIATVSTMTFALSNFKREEKQKNIDFIMDLITSYLKCD